MKLPRIAVVNRHFTITIITLLVVFGLYAFMEYYYLPSDAMERVEHLLNGAKSYDSVILLQIMKTAGSDLQKAADLVLNHFNGEKYKALKAVYALSGQSYYGLCYDLNSAEKHLRKFLPK